MVTTSPSGQRLVIRRNGHQRLPFGTAKLFMFFTLVTQPVTPETQSINLQFQLKDGHVYAYIFGPVSNAYADAYSTAIALVPPTPIPPFFGGYLFNLTTPLVITDKQFVF